MRTREDAEPVVDPGERLLDHREVELLDVLVEVLRRVGGLDVEVVGELAELERGLREDVAALAQVGDLVGEVGGDRRRPAAAGDPGDGDHLRRA